MEDAEETALPTAEVNRDRTVLRHGNWSMIKDMGAYAEEYLRVHCPSKRKCTSLRFFDRTVEIRSTIPLILREINCVYHRFVERTPVEPDLLVHAFYGSSHEDYPFTMTIQAAPGMNHKGDFSAVSCFKSLNDLIFHVHAQIEVFLLTNNPNYSFIHGGAVERNGIGVMLPAESGSGMTTLVLALTLAGYGFLSDEFAVLDNHTGRLFPFPRSCSVREDSLHLFPTLLDRIDQFPKLVSPKETLFSVDPWTDSVPPEERSYPIRYIIFARYTPGMDPSIRDISGVEAFRRLMETESYIGRGASEKQASIDLMLSTLAKAECYDLTTGDLEKTVSLLDSLCK